MLKQILGAIVTGIIRCGRTNQTASVVAGLERCVVCADDSLDTGKRQYERHEIPE